MGQNAVEWERIGRRLLHEELIFEVSERLERAFYEVAEDIQDGQEVTADHLEHLARAFYEALAFVRECIVPLVENPDELSTTFELEHRSEEN